MARKDPRRVGQGPQAPQGIEHHAREVSSAEPRLHHQVGASDVTDEQSVAGQDGFWVCVGAGAEEIAEGLRRVSRGLPHFDFHRPQRDAIPFLQSAMGILGAALGGESDLGAAALREFEVARDEIGVKMRQKDILDLETQSLGFVEIEIDVAARIDADGSPCRRISDEVGGLGEAGEEVLLDDHAGFGSVQRPGERAS